MSSGACVAVCACCVSARSVFCQIKFKDEERKEDGGSSGSRRGEWLRLWFVPNLPLCFIVSFWKFLKHFQSFTTASAKKPKKTKEPEAPILYEDPPDKMTSKDGRSANMKITSWNVDGLRAWVKKGGLDVSLHQKKTCSLGLGDIEYFISQYRFFHIKR